MMAKRAKKTDDIDGLTPRARWHRHKHSLSEHKHSLSKHKLVLAIISVLVALIIGIAGGVRLVYANRILPRVRVGGLAVGGLAATEAKARIIESAEKLARLKIQVSQKEFFLTPETIGVEPDETVNALMSLGKTGTLPEQLLTSFATIARGSDQLAQVVFDEALLSNQITSIAKSVDKPEKDIRLNFKKDKLELLTDTRPGSRIDQAELHSSILDRFTHLDDQPIVISLKSIAPQVDVAMAQENLVQASKLIEPITLKADGDTVTISSRELWETVDSYPSAAGIALDINDDKLNFLVRNIARKINAEPIDARIQIQDGKAVVFAPARTGKTLDQESATKLLTDLLTARKNGSDYSGPYDLKLASTNPSVSTESINSLGIKELIGKGVTSFTGSPPNRIHNLTNGTRFLSGIIIPPGESFSAVKALGNVDDTTGYLPELVIKENRTIPEFGGGLCQVSTTLFRAVLSAGLPIVERQNHSYRVSYYEPPIGLDATVYLPKPDLKFKNDTAAHLLIQGYVTGNKLTFEIYGTNDGRKGEISGPFVSNRINPPPPIHETSSDLPVGVTKQSEKAHQGATAVAYYTVKRDGAVINKQTFVSKYKALPARFITGTGTPPPSPSDQAPTATTPSIPVPESAVPIPTPTDTPPVTPSPTNETNVTN